MKNNDSLTVRDALNEAMSECMEEDEKVFLIGEEVGYYNGSYKVTRGLLDKFGTKRVIDSPITEYGFSGLACGAAVNGLKPIVEYMTFNFAMQAIDHIISTAAKTLYMSGGKIKTPIVFRGPNGSAASVAAQHSQCFASWYAHCPGIKVVSAYNAFHSKKLLMESIKDESPVVFLEHELMYGKTFHKDDISSINYESLKIGQSLVTKPGKDVTIVGFSYAMEKIYLAEKILNEQHGISVEIIDILTLRPLDSQTIFDSVKKTNRLITVEEGWGFSGIGSEISSLVMENVFDYLDHEVLRVYAKDVPLPYASNLEKICIPSEDDIIKACLSMF